MSIIISMADSCILFDLETTGLSTTCDRILQFGAHVLRLKDLGDKPAHFNMLVNPQYPVSEGARRVHQIPQSKINAAGTFDVVFGKFIVWLELVCDTRPIILCAHNGHRFDFPLLVNEILRHNVDASYLKNVKFCDSCFIFKNWFPMEKSYSLGKLHTSLLKMQIKNAHDALGDVVAMRSLIKYALKRNITCNDKLESAVKEHGNTRKYSDFLENNIKAPSNFDNVSSL